MKTIVARYPGKCGACGGKIEVGEKILWQKGSPASHSRCAEPARGRGTFRPHSYRPPVGLDSSDRAEIDMERRERDHDNAEYEAGKADAERYMRDKKIYGEELAEQWEMDAELARYNRGEDY